MQPVSSKMTPRYADVATFMRLPRIDDPAALDIALIGVPWDGGTTNRPGARHGPRGLRDASTAIRGVHPVSLQSPFESRRVGDLGDAAVNPIDIRDCLAGLCESFETIARSGARPLVAGGDHLVSLPILQGLAARQKAPFGMVHFDAHSDTWDSYFGRYRYTHGTPFRRAIEEGLLDPKRVLQIGLRGSLYDPADMDWPKASGIRAISIEEAVDLGEEGLFREIRRVVESGPVYVSFDIDVLDPVYAPGTGTPEIGGFTTREAQRLVRMLDGAEIVGADLVEVSPPFDVGGVTVLAGATLLFELLAAMTGTAGRVSLRAAEART